MILRSDEHLSWTAPLTLLAALLVACGSSAPPDGAGGNGANGTGGGNDAGMDAGDGGSGGTGTGTGAGTGGGTGGGCMNLCTKTNQCPGMTPANCDDFCASTGSLNLASGCGDEYEVFTACMVSLPDICHPAADDCDAQASAYIKCVVTFCSAIPKPPECAG